MKIFQQPRLIYKSANRILNEVAIKKRLNESVAWTKPVPTEQNITFKYFNQYNRLIYVHVDSIHVETVLSILQSLDAFHAARISP